MPLYRIFRHKECKIKNALTVKKKKKKKRNPSFTFAKQKLFGLFEHDE